MLFMERQQVDFRPSFVFHHIGFVLVGEVPTRHDGRMKASGGRDNVLVHKLAASLLACNQHGYIGLERPYFTLT
jgi:hypothetical protein